MYLIGVQTEQRNRIQEIIKPTLWEIFSEPLITTDKALFWHASYFISSKRPTFFSVSPSPHPSIIGSLLLIYLHQHINVLSLSHTSPTTVSYLSSLITKPLTKELLHLLYFLSFQSFLNLPSWISITNFPPKQFLPKSSMASHTDKFCQF